MSSEGTQSNDIFECVLHDYIYVDLTQNCNDFAKYIATTNYFCSIYSRYGRRQIFQNDAILRIFQETTY